MLSAFTPESVRVYLMKDFGVKAANVEKSQVSKRFVADSLRNYLKEKNHSIPETLLNEQSFSYGSHGKPFFSDPMLSGFFFSLSHTKDIAICAIAETEVGCDIEQPGRRGMDRERAVHIAKRYFAPDEYEKIQSGSIDSFFAIWTKKEAYVKWTGRGFTEGFSSFSVFNLPGHVVCENIKLTGAEDAECAICYAREM